MVPIAKEAEWSSGPVYTGAVNLASNRDTIPISSSYTDYAIPAGTPQT
jgi:hypothetical protein